MLKLMHNIMRVKLNYRCQMMNTEYVKSETHQHSLVT